MALRPGCSPQRFGAHDHPGATAERCVVDGSVDVGRVVAGIVQTQIDEATRSGPADHAAPGGGIDDLAEDGEDVDAKGRLSH